MSITFLGHSAFLLEADGTSVLIDPFLTGNPKAAVSAEMTQAAGERNVWLVGGGDLVGQFHDAGLLDQVVATIAPVTLGAGARLLPRRIEGLRLRDVRRFGPMVTLTYDVSR